MPEGTESADAQAAATAAAAAAATAAAGAAGAEPPKLISMSQEDFDRIIQDRVKRAVPADYEDLKKLKADRDAAAEQEKTDLQKANDAKAAAETAAADRTAKADAKLKRAAIIAEATAQKASDVDIVTALLAGSDDITVSDDGEVSGVKDAVKKLLKDKPVLVGGAGSRSGGEFGGNDNKTLDDQIKALEAEGKFAEARDLKIRKGLGIK